MLSNYRILFILILIIVIIFNAIVYNSYRKQLIFIADYNNPGELVWPLDDLKDFNYDLPNISATTLPIKGLMAGYYERDKKYDTAISLLKNSAKFNPFIKFNEFRLAGIYNKIDKPDSALFYYKNAYENTPNNILHGAGYLEYLIEKDSFNLAQKLFYEISDRYKHHYNWSKYLAYLQNKIEIDNKIDYKFKFDSLILIAKERFPDKKYFGQMSLIAKFGLENVIESVKLNDSADVYFNKNEFQNALKLYQESIEIIDDINIYENIFLTNLKMNKFNETRNLYHQINIVELEENYKEHKNGMLDYYMAVSFIEENRDSACYYFKLSKEKGNLESKQFFKNICEN